MIFASVAGIGPVAGKLPNAPRSKVKAISFNSCDPRTLPLKEGSRLVLNSETCHFDLSTSRVAILSERLLATAKRTASSRESNGGVGDDSCALIVPVASATNRSKARTMRLDIEPPRQRAG